MTYVLAFYWPYVAVAFGLGVVIGWWTEGRREVGPVPKRGEGGR